ncbi:hypothetical protein ACIBG7_24945 [Nonomuraea sp. NPDC050328]|uniref:hypothetical protein n=1 Tax=Nonomuraea sp. NPDC050328 TaxID=3364361 RepID=UPI0037B337DD
MTVAVPDTEDAPDNMLRAPRVMASEDPTLTRVLEQEWPRHVVVEARSIPESGGRRTVARLRTVFRRMRRLTRGA